MVGFLPGRVFSGRLILVGFLRSAYYGRLIDIHRLDKVLTQVSVTRYKYFFVAAVKWRRAAKNITALIAGIVST
jgi:hypothetical protein